MKYLAILSVLILLGVGCEEFLIEDFEAGEEVLGIVDEVKAIPVNESNFVADPEPVYVAPEPTPEPVIVVPEPEPVVIEPAPKPVNNCDSNYSGCVPIASDVDCAGGSGNGPAYVSGPVQVIGTDIYRLDRDGDGWACDK